MPLVTKHENPNRRRRTFYVTKHENPNRRLRTIFVTNDENPNCRRRTIFVTNHENPNRHYYNILQLHASSCGCDLTVDLYQTAIQ